MFTKVPSFYGFDDADKVTDFFIHHIEELSDDSIKKLMEIYNNNNFLALADYAITVCHNDHLLLLYVIIYDNGGQEKIVNSLIIRYLMKLNKR